MAACDTDGVPRFFNTAGPVVAAKHYCISPLDRLDLRDVLDLIRTERYFVLHAPRQTGKTSALLALRDLLNGGGEGDYRCVYVNVEPAQAMREDVETAMRAILGALASWARTTLGDGFLDEEWPGILAKHGPAGALGEALARWSEADAKPLVLFVDEIDSLVGDTLLSVLRQLRAGYVRRPDGFPQSVVLCGVRDVRDYRIERRGRRPETTVVLVRNEMPRGNSPQKTNLIDDPRIVGEPSPARFRGRHELSPRPF